MNERIIEVLEEALEVIKEYNDTLDDQSLYVDLIEEMEDVVYNISNTNQSEWLTDS